MASTFTQFPDITNGETLVDIPSDILENTSQHGYLSGPDDSAAREQAPPIYTAYDSGQGTVSTSRHRHMGTLKALEDCKEHSPVTTPQEVNIQACKDEIQILDRNIQDHQYQIEDLELQRETRQRIIRERDQRVQTPMRRRWRQKTVNKIMDDITAIERRMDETEAERALNSAYYYARYPEAYRPKGPKRSWEDLDDVFNGLRLVVLPETDLRCEKFRSGFRGVLLGMLAMWVIMYYEIGFSKEAPLAES